MKVSVWHSFSFAIKISRFRWEGVLFVVLVHPEAVLLHLFHLLFFAIYPFLVNKSIFVDPVICCFIVVD